MVYDETCDFNLDLLFSGGIDPTHLPMTKVNGKCSPLYPHQRIRVNTAFEVAVAAGLQTAYADKVSLWSTIEWHLNITKGAKYKITDLNSILLMILCEGQVELGYQLDISPRSTLLRLTQTTSPSALR
jgi:hypothetical protein